MAAPNEPETVVPDPGATVIVTPQAAPQVANGSEEVQRVEARLEAIETEIRQGLNGEREWTENRLSALTQEIADCRVTLEQAAQNLPSQMQTLREELTQQLQELRQKLEAPRSSGQSNPEALTVTETTVTQVTPPEAPPAPSGEEDTNPIVPAPLASPSARKAPRRV